MYHSRFRSYRAFALASLLGIAVSGCQGEFGGPTAPTAALGAFATGAARAVSGGEAVPLTEVAGSVPAGGSGMLNDIQTRQPGLNNFEFTVNVHGGPPDTDLFFQFVGDIDPATRGDGVCPEAFPSPPGPGNSIRILHTSVGGAASAHIKFEVPEGVFGGAFDSGEKVDFKWRLVNSTQTFELRTPCVVLTGK